MNYLKSIGLSFGGIILITLITTMLYYFNIISTNFLQITNIIVLIFFILLGTIFLGKKAIRRGWLAGLIYGSIFLIIINIFNLALFHNPYQLNNLIYYLIILITSILGSMIGINLKKTK